jgi:multiple sugar transport system permease protein
MTGGGPLDSTQVLVFQAVERGYERQDISGGSTISVLLFLIGSVSRSSNATSHGRNKMMAGISQPTIGKAAAPGNPLRGADPCRDHLHLPAAVHGDVVAESPTISFSTIPTVCGPSCRWAISSLQNYWDAFERAPIGIFVMNSVLVTGTTVVLTLFVCSLAAFSFVFLLEWKGRIILFSVLLATLIIPYETIFIPLLLMASQLPWIGVEGFEIGWLNSYRVQIIPFIADGLTIFLFVQYFRDLPRELIEASRVEGASWWTIYRKVVMPLSGPVLATAAILKFLFMYNQYLWPLMVVQEEAIRPVMVGLGYFTDQLNVPWGEVMAYLTLITVPVLAFYLVLQRAFIASIASTGVKG